MNMELWNRKSTFSIQIRLPQPEKKNIIWTAGVSRRVEIVEIHDGWVRKIKSSFYFLSPDIIENKGYLFARK